MPASRKCSGSIATRMSCAFIAFLRDCAVFVSAGSRAVMTRVWYCFAASSVFASGSSGKSPSQKMAATRRTRIDASRKPRSPGVPCGALTAPNRNRWANHSMYSAPSTTPSTALTARTSMVDEPCRYDCHDASNAPSSTRNSPVNPLVVGSPIEASDRIMKNTEYTGSALARPPYAASSRLWQRS